ncbi:putative transcription factor interactor and regulator CCHC(Zn) family [Helianthus anomalus]
MVLGTSKFRYHIGIRAEGSVKAENVDGGSGSCLREDKGKSVETGFGDVARSGGKSGRGAQGSVMYAQGKPSTRSWKSPVKNFPKKTIPKGFVKKSGFKGKAKVGRPRKAGFRCFKCHQFGHIASICPSKYVHLSPLPVESDYLVNDTCDGDWDSIWVVDPSYKTHMTENKKVFKCFKRHFGLTTNENRKDFSFVHGIGEVKIPVDGKYKTISCVSYVPSLDKNVLSLEQLLYQGIEMHTIGDTVLSKRCFVEKQKYLDKFYENLDVDNGHKVEKAKLRETIEDYYEKEFKKDKKTKAYDEGSSGKNKKEVVYSKKMKTGFMVYYEGLKDNPSESKKALREREVILSQSEDDVVEDDMIIESCLETIDLITLHEELVNHPKFYDATFEDIIIWFVPCFLGIVKECVMPPTLLDGRDVSLILLNRVVNGDGGFKKVMENDTWNEIAFKCGYDPDDAQVVKIAYIYYLELVEWYFDYMMRKKEKIASDAAKKASKVIEEKTTSWAEDDSSDDDLVTVVEVASKNNNK